MPISCDAYRDHAVIVVPEYLAATQKVRQRLVGECQWTSCLPATRNCCAALVEGAGC